MAADIGGILINVAADTAKLVEGMTKAQQVVDRTVKQIKYSLGPLATAFAGVVSIEAMKNIIDTADAIGEQSEKLSLSTEAWSKYIYTAKFAGVEIGTLDTAFSAMIRRTNTFTKDGSGAAATAMEELGISVATARKEFTSTEATFDFLIKKLGEMPDGMKKTAVAQDLFSKSATDVIRYANLGADGIERLGKQAEITGNIISSDFAANAGELNDGLDVLGSMITGIGNKLMTTFTPAMVTASRAVSDFLNIQRQQSAFELKQEIADVEAGLKELNQLSKSRPDLALTYNAEASTQSNKLGILKKQLEDVIKNEEILSKTNTTEFNAGLADVDNEKSIAKKLEQSKKYSTDMLKIQDDFNNKYKQSIMSKSEYELSQLKEDRDKHLAAGNDKIQVEKWYQIELSKINEEIKQENLKNDKEKKDNKKAFDDEYSKMTLSYFAYERLLLEGQQQDWIDQGQDEIKIKQMYANKAKEIAADEADYIRRMEEDKREASGNWIFGMEDALSSYEEMAKDNYYQSRLFFEDTLDGMSSSLADFIMTGKSSFSDFAESILNDLARIASQKAVAGIAGSLFSDSGIGSTLGSIFASAHGNVFNGGHDVAFATGGVVGSPTYFPMTNGKTGLMGEAGPEAIIPLSRIGNDLGVKSTPSKVVLNIENNTSSEISADKISELTRTNENGEIEKVLSIVLNGVGRNTLGLRDALKAVR